LKILESDYSAPIYPYEAAVVIYFKGVMDVFLKKQNKKNPSFVDLMTFVRYHFSILYILSSYEV